MSPAGHLHGGTHCLWGRIDCSELGGCLCGEEKCYASEARTIRVVKTESTYRVAWAGILSDGIRRAVQHFSFRLGIAAAGFDWLDIGGIVGKPLPAGQPEWFLGDPRVINIRVGTDRYVRTSILIHIMLNQSKMF